MRRALVACLVLPLAGCECSVSFGPGVSRETPVLPQLAHTAQLPPPTAASASPPRSTRVSGGPATVRGDVCITGAARRWSFPAPKAGGIAVVGYPVALARE